MAEAQLHCDDSHSDRKLEEATEGGVRFQMSKCENRTKTNAFSNKVELCRAKGKGMRNDFDSIQISLKKKKEKELI